ncbi:astacin-like metalloprotease toxin 1 [Centruroides sculpturatus]|uniref:astacin-like metalloprotease toxin 1 n=1 Tax=Centruroides sculpturatus TaxID=218467 RepID=UPI000C6D2E19|nr:astacin-like metalloprotease toxin 1 [Centruroides sculpturatus]
MNHINNATGGCITFKQRQNEPDYILFIKGDSCSSYVGRVKGEQYIILKKRCEYVGTIVHEIVHALGFYHEQNRPDRDNYLIIHWENIKEGEEVNFERLSPDKITIYNDFDYESIMLYGNYVFSKDGKSMTIEAKSGVELLHPYIKGGLSPSDVYRIKKLYEFDLPSKALQNPHLFQGDIIGIRNRNVRNAITDLSLRWERGIVYYTIHPSLESITHLITESMNHINNATGGCITFKQRQNEPDYILFIKGDSCSSYVGRVKGEQYIILKKRCEYVGTIVHEIVHALGFYHEQNRPDRDNYLIIHWENIKEGEEVNFERLSPDKITIYNDFDYESIMLYGNYVFSKDGKSMTIEAKSGVELLHPYIKGGLSPSDVYRIKKLYECE